jgi:hypothetical protein
MIVVNVKRVDGVLIPFARFYNMEDALGFIERETSGLKAGNVFQIS